MDTTLVAPRATSADRIPGRFERTGRWVLANPALVAIVAVAALVRVLWLIKTDPGAPVEWVLSGDQYGYYHHGMEIAAGRGYHSYLTGEPTAYYPVGYPLILGALFWVVGHTPLPDDYMRWALVLNVVVSTASVVLAAIIGRRLFGRLGGLAGAAVLAVLPNIVYQVASVQLETMVIFWYLAAVAVVVGHDWRTGAPSTRRLLAFGAVLGGSVLVRPFSLWFLPALGIAALVAGVGWRRALRTVAIPAAVVVLVSLPWVIRNAIVMDAFVPTSTNTGDTLCLDRFAGANGRFRWADHEGCADPTLPEVPRNAESTRMAASWVVHHPGRELLQIWRRGLLIFGTDHDGIEAVNTLGGGAVLSEPTSHRLSRIADDAFVAVEVLAAVGFIVLVGRRAWRRPDAVFVVLCTASLIAVPLLLWGNPRFHLPVSPFLAVFAGGAIAAGVEVIGRRRPARH